MLTFDEVQKQTKKAGANIAPRTFWKYVDLGLLPAGQRVPGQGNLLYFPDGTVDSVVQIYLVSKEIGIYLPILQRSLLYLLDPENLPASVVKKPPSAFDLIVWFAGMLVKLELLQKQSLDQQDLASLNARVKKLFRKFGVASGNTDPATQETLSLDLE